MTGRWRDVDVHHDVARAMREAVGEGLLVAPTPAGGPRRMSAVDRGSIANRRSVAVGYGRTTIPVIVAVRPSITAVDAIAASLDPTTSR